MVTIYALKCAVNGMAYIGCTRGKLNKRMREHRCLLNHNKHSEPLLQADWNAYGESGFVMQTLETFVYDESVTARREAETRWMAEYDLQGRLYNTNRTSFAPKPEAIAKGVACSHLTKGNRWTPEANEKRRLAQLGIPKGHGAKISATKQARKLMR